MGYFEWGQIVRLHEFVTPARLEELEEAVRLLETAGFWQQAEKLRAWAKELAEALESESSPPTELWWG